MTSAHAKPQYVKLPPADPHAATVSFAVTVVAALVGFVGWSVVTLVVGAVVVGLVPAQHLLVTTPSLVMKDEWLHLLSNCADIPNALLREDVCRFRKAAVRLYIALGLARGQEQEHLFRPIRVIALHRPTERMCLQLLPSNGIIAASLS